MVEHAKLAPEQVPIELIAQHGPALLRDPKRLKGLLWDLCHDRPRERRVLFAVVEIGLAADLARNGRAVAWEIQGARLVNLLHDETGIDLGLAGWAIETWAVALEVLPRERLSGAPARVGAPDVAPHPLEIGRRVESCGIADRDWAAIPAGEFLMGSPRNAAGRGYDERQHQVRVAAFRMLKTPVTWAMYETFCAATGRLPSKAPPWGPITDHPVVNVSYLDAVDYAEWLARVTGWHCRLPTEAEWEYACRAGTTTPFWTGRIIANEQSNFDRQCTTPVTAFPANPWGLHDMHGNVWEWTCSAYAADYDGRELVCECKNDVSFRSLRGGSWGNSSKAGRSANRNWGTLRFRNVNFGFRLAQDSL